MRAYRWLLRLCPAPLRREFGAAMEETFARRLHDARETGRVWRPAWVCGRELAGLVALALSERLRPAVRAGRHRRPALATRKAARMDGLRQEIRQAARRLVSAPGFTVATLATLALAIAANTAIFAVIHRVILNPLPYADSDRLIALRYAMPTRNVPAVYTITARFQYQYLDHARTLAGVALYWPLTAGEMTLTGQGTPERIRVIRAAPSLLPVLRATPAQGRWFTEAEGAPGAVPVAVVSHGIWVRRFAQDPRIVGRTVSLDGVATTIVGIMRPSFAFPDASVDLWLPATLSRATANDAFMFGGIARLRDGATIDEARAELTRLTVELESISPGNGYQAMVSTATSLIDSTVGAISRTLWMLMAAVGLVLLVACANIANLFLVRSEARQREIAVRRALGAGSRAVARYFLSESALLAVAGGTIGLALAWVAVRLLVTFGPASLPRLGEVRLDGTVLIFAFAVSAAAAVVFGAIPLFRFTPLAVCLHEIGRGHTASRIALRARHLLMGGQIATALVLLVASGLMLRSFQQLRAVDPGFDTAPALTFRVGFPRADYPDRASAVAAQRAILERLAGLPGVTRASASTCLPLSERHLCQAGPLFVEGREPPSGAIAPFVAIRGVAGEYFETMGMRLLRGRGIDRAAVVREEPIVVVNEALARSVFPNQDPIGRRVRLGNPALSRVSDWLTIAGVVSNTPTVALAEAAAFPQMFVPVFSSREVSLAPRFDQIEYVIRTARAPLALVEPARRAIGEVDRDLAMAGVGTLQDILDRASAQMAFTMVLLVVAAAVALMLGLVGIYGVMSYIVTRRTGEIGIRLALGARPASVAAAIVRQSAAVALAGIAVGLAAAFAGSRVIESLLYGVSPRDPVIFGATTLLLLCTAILACWLPARRGARLSPLEALRTE